MMVVVVVVVMMMMMMVVMVVMGLAMLVMKRSWSKKERDAQNVDNHNLIYLHR